MSINNNSCKIRVLILIKQQALQNLQKSIRIKIAKMRKLALVKQWLKKMFF